MELWTSTKIKPDYEKVRHFLQKMVNRLIVGHERYGPPDKKKKYLKRIELELRAYKRSGNLEHLVNMANYCFLEHEAPQNSKAHEDKYASSVTRGVL